MLEGMPERHSRELWKKLLEDYQKKFRERLKKKCFGRISVAILKSSEDFLWEFRRKNIGDSTKPNLRIISRG